jgi:hypothetical protein
MMIFTRMHKHPGVFCEKEKGGRIEEKARIWYFRMGRRLTGGAP